MTVTSSVRQELSKLNPTSIIELFELQTYTRLHGECEIYRFHAGANAKTITGHLVWNASTYYAWPVQAEGFELALGGTLPRPSMKVSNIEGSISAILLQIASQGGDQGLIGAEVKRIRTLARFLDAINFEGNVNPFGTPDPLATLPEEIWYIDRKAVENKDLIEFELAAAFDVSNVRLPKRQVLEDICTWIYRGEECGYTGTNYFNENNESVATAAEDVCGKRLRSCEKRFGEDEELPYGGFPGVGQYQF